MKLIKNYLTKFFFNFTKFLKHFDAILKNTWWHFKRNLSKLEKVKDVVEKFDEILKEIWRYEKMEEIKKIDETLRKLTMQKKFDPIFNKFNGILKKFEKILKSWLN